MTDKPYIQCPNGDRIYAGEYGRTRIGGKIGPMNIVGSGVSSFNFIGDDHNDIIAKWTDEPAAPEVGTLSEIGVKPGDVVECVGNIAAHNSLTVGKQYIIDCDGTPIDDNGRNFAWTKAKFRIISRASDALPYGHARLPSGKVVDLTAIREPFGLLDEDVKQAMRDHGGPYEYWDNEWEQVADLDEGHGFAHRVKPQPSKPVVGEVVMTGWITKRGPAFSYVETGSDTHRLTLPTRDNQLVPGTYTGPDGLVIKVEAL